MKILIIQKDLSLAKELKISWKKKGNFVDITRDYQEALSYYYNEDYHVVILDTWIKGGDAFDLFSKMKTKNSKTAFFFLSKDSSYLLKQRAFHLGADVYLSSEVSQEEIYWQTKALGNRVLLEEQKESEMLSWRDFKIDLFRREVYKNGKKLNIRGKEYALLVLLITNKGFILKRSTLQKEVCGEDVQITSNIIDTYVKNLRKKIKDENKKIIKTIRGYGYGIEDDEKGESDV